MKGLVGGPLLVGGLGPGPPEPPLNPALARRCTVYCVHSVNDVIVSAQIYAYLRGHMVSVCSMEL